MRNKKHVVIIRPTPERNPIREGISPLPLGPLYIAESLIQNGYDVSIIDNVDNENTLKTIERFSMDNILSFGISTMSGSQLSNAIFIASKLKSKYPDIPIIWGGVHVTALPETTLRSHLVDYIIWGEAEGSILELLHVLKNENVDSLKDVPGIGYKKGSEQYIGSNSGYTSLNKTFHLPYHLLDMKKHTRKLIIGANKDYSIYTSRGCPFRCNFCSNSSKQWPNTRVRRHTIDHVVNDVKILVNKYGADMISISDECFLIPEERAIELLEAMRAEGIFIKYRFCTRIDLLSKMKEETWKLLKEYGVVAINCAPESGSQKVLDAMGKRITLEQIYKVDELLTKYRFYKSFNILICTPVETREDLKLTLELVSNLARTSTYCPYPLGELAKYIPLPDTEFYNESIKLGFKPPTTLEEWGKFDFENFSNTKDLVRPWIPKEDLDYIEQAIYWVEKLNVTMKGPGTDSRAVNEILYKINNLIAGG